MFHAMYAHVDRYGKTHYTNARIGGYKTEDQARRAVVRNGPDGYVTDDRDVCLFIVRKGHVVKPFPNIKESHESC